MVEFNRTNDQKQEQVARDLEKKGFEFVAGAVDSMGDPEFATEIRLRRRQTKDPRK